MDEKTEAFERGLKTMEPIALELYRRGREPLLAELETVKRERDEARAEVERLRAQYAATVLEHGKMLIEAVDSAKRQKSLADRAHDQACRLAAKVDAQSTDQFRRGAEAMREACAVALLADGLVLSRERAANVVRALPTPEEP